MAEEGNVDEAVSAEAKASKIWKLILKITKDTSILEIVNIDIQNINTFEKRNKVYTTRWRTISKVIEPDFSMNMIRYKRLIWKETDD